MVDHDYSYYTIEIRKLTDNLKNEKKKEKSIQKIETLVNEAKNTLDINNKEFVRIIDTLNNTTSTLIRENNIKDAGLLSDVYLELIMNLNDKQDFLTRSKSLSKLLLENKDMASFVLAEDILNQVVEFLDLENKLNDAGSILVENASYLARKNRHEQAIALYNRGVSYLVEDKSNSSFIKEILLNILDIARELSALNNNNSSKYIDLANEITSETGIEVDRTTTEAAYNSYSDFLLSKSKTMIEGKAVQHGRLHKKKREFFKKE